MKNGKYEYEKRELKLVHTAFSPFDKRGRIKFYRRWAKESRIPGRSIDVVTLRTS